ncbi:unnamed protein product [Darwinula stevensoni]|uniref:Uncharacterized protein n=1 Tax=Darwinula stevensoni TaxID=69355 RepID=A0A7R9AGP8_9CRUS|nr:unnamed protein product [Darwinula stevensoni]CAG0903633.1 unnamed protein product [Darwinula stevensoni]
MKPDVPESRSRNGRRENQRGLAEIRSLRRRQFTRPLGPPGHTLQAGEEPSKQSRDASRLPIWPKQPTTSFVIAQACGSNDYFRIG